MRLLPVVIVLAVAALACGSEESSTVPIDSGAGGNGGDGGPRAPVFGGLTGVVYDSSIGAARLSWLPAEDAETPAEELTYKVWVWDQNPCDGFDCAGLDGAASGGTAYEWTQPLSNCSPSCRFSYSLTTQRQLAWFAVEVTDADGMSSGIEMVLPAVAAPPDAQPTITRVEPSTVQVGDQVTITGSNFFDERGSLDGLTLAGEPIPATFVQGWNNDQIRFVVPLGSASGALGIKTLLGEVTAELVVE